MSRLEIKRYKWDQINWRKLKRSVFKLQKRIYQASQKEDFVKVHNLQKLLIKSRSAKLLAIKKVSQENEGKKTAGVDGIKSLNNRQRLEMVRKLKLGSKSKPV